MTSDSRQAGTDRLGATPPPTSLANLPPVERRKRFDDAEKMIGKIMQRGDDWGAVEWPVEWKDEVEDDGELFARY